MCLLLVVYGLLRFARNDEKRTVIAKAIIPTSSLRRPIAISFILGLSLREPKVRGNLSMGYNIIHSILLFCLFADNKFFLFSVFVLTIGGLWIASSFHSSQWQRNKRQYPSHRHCDYETIIARLCRRSENLVIETTTHNPHRHCENLTTHCHCKGQRPVAISVWWDTETLNHHFKSHHSHAIPLHHNKHTIISKLYIK